MPLALFSTLKNLFEGDPAVRRVADDPALTAELLLLFRMVLADGEADEAELATLKRICSEAFGIGEESFAEVAGYLHDYGYETTVPQALDIFRGFPHERRVRLAQHLAEIAKADRQLKQEEVRLLARTLEVLRLEPGEVVPKGA